MSKKVCKNCNKSFESNDPGRVYISLKEKAGERRVWYCSTKCFKEHVDRSI